MLLIAVSSTTIDKVGVKDVTILTTGHEKQRLTVMLSARADGRKLAPYIILKRIRRMPELERQFPMLKIAYSSNGWMNEECTLDYLTRVIGAFCFKQRMLVWDRYKCHLTKDVGKQLKVMKVDSLYVPRGCTKYVQVYKNKLWIIQM